MSHGSLQDVNINGVSFVPTADSDIDTSPSEWTHEAEPNGSGPASIKSTKKVPKASGIVLRTDSTTESFLIQWADAGEWLEFFVTKRDGSVWGCMGLLQIESTSSMSGTTTISIECQTKWDISAA